MRTFQMQWAVRRYKEIVSLPRGDYAVVENLAAVNRIFLGSGDDFDEPNLLSVRDKGAW